MIELGSDGALLLVGTAVVVVVAWGASVSVRSASRGPRWALEHLAAVRPTVLGGVIVGVVLTVLVRPLWTGLAVLYVALTVLLLSVMLRRSLVRLDELGGLDGLPLERRREIVGRARVSILAAGVLLAAIGVWGVTAGAGVVAWIPAILGFTLVATAVSLSAEGRKEG